MDVCCCCTDEAALSDQVYQHKQYTLEESHQKYLHFVLDIDLSPPWGLTKGLVAQSKSQFSKEVPNKVQSRNLKWIKKNKSAAGIAWCPATALTSSKVTVLNLCTSSGHALYLYQVMRNYLERYQSYTVDIIFILKIQRGIILQKDRISILTIYKITKGHKTAKKCRRSNSS